MKAPVRGLGSDFGCSWRPSWGHVDNLGGYLGGLKAPVGSRRRFWVLSETILGPCWRSWGLSWNFEGPSWYLGGDFGCSWRPSWSHVGDLGGYLGHLRAYAGRSWLGKPTKWTSYRYLRGFVAKKFCDWQSSWGHLGASLSLLGPSWRPSWAMLEILGAILGIFELMLDEVGLGNRPSGLRIGICEVFAKKFCGGAGKCWQVLGGPAEWRVAL